MMLRFYPKHYGYARLDNNIPVKPADPIQTQKIVKISRQFIKKTALDIFSNLEKFKTILYAAISAYLEKNESNCFGCYERAEVNNLQIKIHNAKSIAQLMLLLNGVVKGSNNTLILCIFNYINSAYCGNRLPKLNVTIKLSEILKEIDNYQATKNKILLCFAAFEHNPNSSFNRLPIELVQNITMKLNKL